MRFVPYVYDAGKKRVDVSIWLMTDADADQSASGVADLLDE